MKNHNQKILSPVDFERRRWLQMAVFGSGLLGLRAAASGIPAHILASPQTTLLALSDEEARRQLSAVGAQYLIAAVSDDGEPMNCNVPGTYDDPAFRHPTAPSMAPTEFALGGENVKAAAVWATLDPSTLARSCFFHHGTGAISHGELASVFALRGLVPKNEQMFSAMARPLAESLGTMQSAPINISGIGNGLSSQGVQQPTFRPTAIKSFLSPPSGISALMKASDLRDRDLNALNDLLKQSGTTAQKNLLDAWAKSQDSARKLSQDVITKLGAIGGDSYDDQVKCAALLCALKLAPILMVNLPFGGDNHVDNDPHAGPGKLPVEAAEHVVGVAAIKLLQSSLADLGLSDDVTFMTLTTFGRTNSDAALSGRTHNPQHTANLMIGKNIRGSVVGGAKIKGINLQAMNIDSQTGRGVDGGDIAYADTLGAFGATLGAALGLADEQLTDAVGSTLKVKAALA